MPFVLRDNQDRVIAAAFSPQPGWPEDFLAEDHADVQAFRDPLPARTAKVDAERDRRIDAGFIFGGVLYQARPFDRQNIAGAGTMAGLAVMAGAQPADLRWHEGEEDFAWLAADNTPVPMDAQTCLAFAKAAAAHVSRHVFAGRAIKQLIEDGTPPPDITDNALWP